MTETENLFTDDDRELRVTVVFYYAVMLAGFVIGLYGLFSLISLAGAATQGVHIASMP